MRLNKIQYIVVLFIGIFVCAQESTYDPHFSFAPDFYNNNGNEFRSAQGTPGPKYWQNEADYDLKAELFPDQNKVEGSVTIHYTNNSPQELNYLWLQLDQNLFKPNSRGQNMISGDSRYGNRGEKINGGFTISQVQLNGKQPFYVIDGTRMQIRLATPLAAQGGKVSFSMNFSFNIPENGSDRMGHLSTKNGEIFSIAQWYPRMCVYDDINGWNTLPYLGAGEFYCEYGDVNMEFTVPANQFVVASGELLNAKEVMSKNVYNRWEKAKKSSKVIDIIPESEVKPYSPTSKKQTWKYRIENTRDVAWASSNAFVVQGVEAKLSSGKSVFSLSAHPVESNTKNSYGRAAEYVKTSIEFYSDYLVEYPYPMAINVATNQGGMEYPGIVFCGWDAKNEYCWGVIDHEFGHIWFPMIVGSNERKYGWMDEGFNTFINSLSARNYNNGEYIKAGELPVAQYASILANPAKEYIYLMPDAMKEANIGLELYWKPGMGLQLLREVILGEEKFDYAFRQYTKNWAFKHPMPEDFFRSMENAAGEDLAWFWRSWFMNNHSLDQAITQVEQSGNMVNVTVANLKEMPMPIFLTLKDSEGNTYEHHQEVDVWMRNTKFTIGLEVKGKIVSVELDKAQQLPDVNRDNNLWKADK